MSSVTAPQAKGFPDSPSYQPGPAAGRVLPPLRIPGVGVGVATQNNLSFHAPHADGGRWGGVGRMRPPTFWGGRSGEVLPVGGLGHGRATSCGGGHRGLGGCGGSRGRAGLMSGGPVNNPETVHVEEDDDGHGGDAWSPSIKADKADWSERHTLIFCELYVEQMRAGNWNNGVMTTEGYQNISHGYYKATGLMHERKQLSNRASQLKQKFNFLKNIYLKQSGLGRGKGTIVADPEFWETVAREYRKYRFGPPPYLEHLREMFDSLVVDGSTSRIPGEAEPKEEGSYSEQDNEHSPMSTNSRKRASSTSTTASCTDRKSKSQMKLMQSIMDRWTAGNEATQRVMEREATMKQAEAEKMEKSIKKCQQLAEECGAKPNSIAYFVAGMLFKEAENRVFFCNISTPEDRLLWLQR